MSILQQLTEVARLWRQVRRLGKRIDEGGRTSDSKRVFPRRPITEQEIAIVRLTLEVGATKPIARESLDRLSDLEARSGCGCGCESVDFEDFDPARAPQPLGHTIGTTPTGGTVGIIIWGRADAVTGLEVYDIDCGGDSKLPVPSTLTTFDKLKEV